MLAGDAIHPELIEEESGLVHETNFLRRNILNIINIIIITNLINNFKIVSRLVLA